MTTLNNQSEQKPIVLITRAVGQQSEFANKCQSLGFDVSLLPCIDIVPVDQNKQTLPELLREGPLVLFTSANAVRYAHALFPMPWSQIAVHAIGAATARELKHHHQPVALEPQSPYNSESYLQQLSTVTPGSVLIIKGYGGRDLIRQTLTARGWHVGTLDVYKRVLPTIESSIVDAILTVTPPDIISATSNEILDNLWQIGHQHQTMLQTRPLILNSQRCANLASDLGFENSLLVAKPAGDIGQLIALEQWKRNWSQLDSNN